MPDRLRSRCNDACERRERNLPSDAEAIPLTVMPDRYFERRAIPVLQLVIEREVLPVEM